MIKLHDVSIFRPGIRPGDPILLNANTRFGTGERIGILAKIGTGKSSIARMLSGVDEPDQGHVERQGRVSWPIGFAGFLHPNLTVAKNLEFFARLIGMPVEQVIDFCDEFCQQPGLLSKFVKDLTPTQRAMLSYSCAMVVDTPTTYIADEVIAVGVASDRERCDEVLFERLQTGGLVYLSRNIRQIERYCDRYYVFINNRLIPCDDLVAAQRALDRTTTQPKEQENV